MEFLEKLRIISSWTGFFHTLMAILAMIFGSVVLLGKKGRKKHKRRGYVYVVSMLLMNGSAFGVYNFGDFSLFHAFAVISLITLVLGIVPAISKANPKWYGRHFYFMSWSVVGLYCAFWAEIGVRLVDMRYFWWVVMLATVLTATCGAIIIRKEAVKVNLA